MVSISSTSAASRETERDTPNRRLQDYAAQTATRTEREPGIRSDLHIRGRAARKHGLSNSLGRIVPYSDFAPLSGVRALLVCCRMAGRLVHICLLSSSKFLIVFGEFSLDQVVHVLVIRFC
jgi:hypothetical protein